MIGLLHSLDFHFLDTLDHYHFLIFFVSTFELPASINMKSHWGVARVFLMYDAVFVVDVVR